jgi:hypothetical protein
MTPPESIQQHAARLNLVAEETGHSYLGQVWTIRDRDGGYMVSGHFSIAAAWLGGYGTGWQRHAASLVTKRAEVLDWNS